ncbi:serine hydrolase domain-containing protein [Paucibacter sp. APW11]|uniref:Serine hydrolase domain-containing protein n=1 Tax=Roseateles aquae TaxID=3077235 RepID=A0ABU3PHA2_9BURK|nr:serine hydrolase domain-containing protein [Paucibacter sp. APW11]MDT9001829.1 serine hydrolase domain-containing protein [Paucibacter sp. APW11]
MSLRPTRRPSLRRAFCRQLLAIAGTSLLLHASATAAEPPVIGDTTLEAQLQQALHGSRVPAIAAAEIRAGQLNRLAVAGQRRNDGQDPVQLGDRWLIGSNGKPITAALIARLVDQGRLAWDTPLAELLPELKAGMHSAYRKVTLLELLSHRAGLPENVSDLKFFERFAHDRRALPAQRLAYVSRALRDKPIAPPGSKISYSNTGFILAAVIAERHTGRDWETLMREQLMAPLGMDSLAFGTTGAGEPRGHLKGKPALRPEDSNPLMFAPAGNVSMSLQDWARFCLDQLAGARGEGRLLSQDSYQRLQSLRAGALPASQKTPAALGWGVQASVAGRPGPVLLHGGSDGNWFALVALFPESGDGALVVANAGPDMGGEQLVSQVFVSLLPPKP